VSAVGVGVLSLAVVPSSWLIFRQRSLDDETGQEASGIQDFTTYTRLLFPIEFRWFFLVS